MALENDAHGGTGLLLPPIEVLPESFRPSRDHGDGGDRFDDGGGAGGGGGGGGGGEPGAPDPTGDASAAFGVRVAMLCVTTLFSVFIGALILFRASSESWPPAGVQLPPALWGATAILVVSAVCAQRAVRHRQRGSSLGLMRWLGWSLRAGGLFVGVQLIVWFELWNAGTQPSSNGFGAVFYTLTGLHALHVIAGLGALWWFLRRVRSIDHIDLLGRGTEHVVVFWHFLSGLWAVVLAAVAIPG